MLSGSIRILFFLGDLLLLNLSTYLSLYVFGDSEAGKSEITYLLFFSNVTWLFLVLVSSPYEIHKGWAASKILKSQLAFLFVHVLVVASLMFFFKQVYSIREIALIYLSFIPFLFIFRISVLYFRRVSAKEIAARRYLLIGRNEIAEGLRRFYLSHPEEGYKFVGYFDLEDGEFDTPTFRSFCATNDVQEIFLCQPGVDQAKLRQLIEFGLDSLIKVKLMTGKAGDPSDQMIVDRLDVLPTINAVTSPLDDATNQVVKRIFDILFSLAFSVLVLSWLLPLVGLAIKLDSRGPIFFVQLRSGRGNRPFKCLKLRTMVVNSDSDSKQATKDDKRITKLGHFLRKTSIDELPQFLNVLVGSMSIVGPRPHMLLHTDIYSKHIEKFLGRQYVKPGVTGLAQCLGYRGETKDLIDMENRVRMDRYYIDNWSFWLDIKIIFLTVISLVRGSEKAY